MVADSLSRDHHIPNQALTQLLLSCCPEQVPQGFHTCPVPQKIASWLFQTLQLSMKPPQDPREPMTIAIGAGLVGKKSCHR